MQQVHLQRAAAFAAQISPAARPFKCLGVVQVDAVPCCRWEIPVLVGRPDVEDVLTETRGKAAGKQQQQRRKTGTTAPGR